MKPLTILIIAVAVYSHADAANAPERLTGAIFSEIGSQLTAARPPQSVVTSTVTNTYILNTDGSFSHLFSQVKVGTTLIADVRLRPSGVWSYRKVDADTAILTIDETVRTLRFIDTTSGTWTNGISANFATEFSMKPFAARSRVANLSNRSFVRAGDQSTSGFVVTGEGTLVLVRAVGPGLEPFGVTDPLRRPRLRVSRAGSAAELAANEDWLSGGQEIVGRIAQMASAIGAFPLSNERKDAALLLTLDAGAYLAEVSSVDRAETGEVLIEIYLIP